MGRKRATYEWSGGGKPPTSVDIDHGNGLGEAAFLVAVRDMDDCEHEPIYPRDWKALKSDPPPPGVKSATHLVNDMIRKKREGTSAALEGFARYYCEVTGYSPADVRLVVRNSDDATIYFFEKHDAAKVTAPTL